MTLNILKKITFIVITFSTVSLSGCATTEDGARQKSIQWEGKDTTALIEQWGPTEDMTTLSDGSKLWVYRKTKETTVGEQVPVKTTTKQRTESYVVNGVTMTRQVNYEEANYEPSASRLTNCEARFIIKDGVVKSAEIKGDGCVAEDFKNGEKVKNHGDKLSNP